MQGLKKTVLTLLAVAFILFSFTVYAVYEGQVGLLLQLGKLVEDPKTKEPLKIMPGIHFKLPLIQQIHKLDARVQTLDVQRSRVPTKKQNFLIVDYYAKWAVESPSLFYKRTGGSKTRAEALLKQQINDDLRTEFSKRTILQVIADDRTKIMNILRTQADANAQDLGIRVLDVRIKQIELPESINNSVYKRMRKKREVMAQDNRSTGIAEKEIVEAKADAEAAIKIANAKAEAANIRAVGVKRASEIYADAYGKNKDFYKFYQSLQSYERAFADKGDLLVVDANSEFLKYFSTIDSADQS